MSRWLTFSQGVDEILRRGQHPNSQLAGSEERRRKSPSEIFAEEAGARKGHNNFDDAIRHAETSRRLSEAYGVPTAWVLGTGLELVERLLLGEPAGEMIMDLHNNREGRRASRERRAIDPTRLQTAPGGSPTPKRDYPYR